MNRHERRAQRAAERKRQARSNAIAISLAYLGGVAAPTVTGATLFCPDGESIYLDADAARAMAGTKPAGGRA